MCPDFFYPDNMDKTIITVTGKDTVGIIARICTILAENKVNILDITQTIVDGVKYVPYNSVIQTNSMGASDAVSSVLKA